MAYDYKEITNKERRQLARDQMRQHEAELFGHELNLAKLEAARATIPADDQEGLKENQRLKKVSQAAVTTLTMAITTIKAERDKIADTA